MNRSEKWAQVEGRFSPNEYELCHGRVQKAMKGKYSPLKEENFAFVANLYTVHSFFRRKGPISFSSLSKVLREKASR
jgi:hypothetical protein